MTTRHDVDAHPACEHRLSEALRERTLDAYLESAQFKQRVVTPIFDTIAPSYDRFTRLFSFGMDRRWKRELLAHARTWALPDDALVLDLACGTGDLAFAIAQRFPAARVIGIDPAARMLEIAERRRLQEAPRGLSFMIGDMMQLGFGDGSVDAVTMGYALRNAPDFRAALREAARVLKPGGSLVVLDLYRPPTALWARAFVGYVAMAGSIFGWLWHRRPVVYGYIARSMAHFVTAPELKAVMEQSGFDVVQMTSWLGGGAALHYARRAQLSGDPHDPWS